jgi:hypothetical protein
VCHIELDKTTGARLQVHEEQPILRPHQVACVWFSVQQLLSGAALTDVPCHRAEVAGQPFRVPDFDPGANHSLRVRDTIREVRSRRRMGDLPQ